MTAPNANASPPLACDLGALDPKQRERHAELWRHARALAPEPVSTERGVAFRFPPGPDLAGQLVELAGLERLCCPFLRISVTFEAAEGPLTLELSGDAGVRAFLTGGVGRS